MNNTMIMRMLLTAWERMKRNRGDSDSMNALKPVGIISVNIKSGY